MKIPFDIKFRPQIESGKYKVETDSKEPVTIIKWDLKNEDGNILCYYFDSKEEIPYVTSGKDLFIITLEPELSEDERIREAISYAIGTATNQYGTLINGVTEDEAVAYLEKQKDEAQKQFNLGIQAGKEEAMYEMEKEQKSAEWSEEDEAMLKEIISFFKDGSVKLQHDLDLYAGFLENRLKSLRPQPHWKPSKEQMIALESSYSVLKAHDTWDEDEHLPLLLSLYNDLKKL